MDKRFIAAALAGFIGFGTANAVDLDSNTTIGGQLFADFSHITEQQNGADVPPTGTGFNVKRAYLIVNHTFDDVFSANLTTDAQYISSATGTGYANSTTSNSGGVTELFVKLLYLQAKLNDALVVHAGSYTSPWVGYVQNLYGYRYVDRTVTDRLGFASTADWGLNATGVAGDNGLFNYSASAVNGRGYKDPTHSKDVDFEAAGGVKPLSWLNLGVGFYSGHLGQITQATASYASNTARRWDVAAAAITGGLRVGAEYFDAKNFKAAGASTGVLSGPGGVVVATNITTANPTGSVASDDAAGYSAWVSYAFTKQWALFGRYDQNKLSKDIDPNLKDTYYNVGVAFKPSTPLDLALVYKHEKVTDGTISIGGSEGNASYTIGGTGVAGTGIKTGGQVNEVGVYTQYVF